MCNIDRSTGWLKDTKSLMALAYEKADNKGIKN